MKTTKILREHRNMLAYYNVDEPNLVNPDERIAAAEWYWNTVNSIDPYRPHVFAVFTEYSRVATIGRAGARCWDTTFIRTRLSRDFTANRVCTRPVTRMNCGNDAGRTTRSCFLCRWRIMLGGRRTPIGMSKAHMLCQAYTAVIYGSRGLLYFVLSSVIGEDAWDALRTINAQIKELAPALLNGDIAQNISYTPDNFRPSERKFPMVNAAVFKYPDGDYLLMAANIMPVCR